MSDNPTDRPRQTPPDGRAAHPDAPVAVPHAPMASVAQILAQLVDPVAVRHLEQAAAFFVTRFFDGDTTVGLSITRTVRSEDAGLSGLYPLLAAGYVDWIVLTGENLRQDTLERTLEHADRDVARAAVELPELVRVLDQLLPKAALLEIDEFMRRLIESAPFQKICSSAELHRLLGKFLLERERLLHLSEPCLLSVAYRHGVPVYTPFAGESFAGTHAAAAALTGNRLVIDAIQDVNETAALLFAAKDRGRSAVLSLGGGTPENFALQAARHLTTPLGFGPHDHDVLLRIKQPRPGEPARAPGPAEELAASHPSLESLVVFADTSLALPLLALAVLEQGTPRPCKRLLDQSDDAIERLRESYLRHSLERQQQDIQERVRRTVATLQERVHETHEHIQQRVQETQTHIQSKVSETRGAIQTEIARLQRQFALQVQRLIGGRIGATEAGRASESGGSETRGPSSSEPATTGRTATDPATAQPATEPSNAPGTAPAPAHPDSSRESGASGHAATSPSSSPHRPVRHE